MEKNYLNAEHPGVQAELEKNKKELLEFIQTMGVTAEEVRVAHEIALGIQPEKVVREEVYQLAHKMDQSGLPLDALAEVVGKIKRLEKVPQAFTALLENLQISEGEKTLLRSIAEGDRPGELMVYTPKKEEAINKCVIAPHEAQGEGSQRKIIEKLTGFLEEFKGKNIEVGFTDAVALEKE